VSQTIPEKLCAARALPHWPHAGAAGEIRAGNSPSGAQMLERIAVPAGTLTTATYVGEFAGWFADGDKYFTTSGNTVRVNAADGTQLDIAALPTTRELQGRGNWFWTIRDTGLLEVYAVGSAGVAATSLTSTLVSAAGPDLLVTHVRGFEVGNWVELTDDSNDLVGQPICHATRCYFCPYGCSGVAFFRR
jgi:hypothetical protein